MARSSILLLLAAALSLGLLAACKTSSIESRKRERRDSYDALSPDFRALVDQGRIAVGMTEGAVYIAWGPPAQVLMAEDGRERTSQWLYHGTWMEETRYWTYREVPAKQGVLLERTLEKDYDPRDYVRAEIVFVAGKVARWRTLPRPVN
jgi:hypothetical protein